MAEIHGLSDTANRQLRQMFRDFYATYVAPVALRKRWHNTGGSGGCTGTTTLTDGCECNTDSLVEGVTLPGDPLICCEGHLWFTINLGTTIGEKTLYHLGGDIWSTYNSDSNLDNPWTNSCGSGDGDDYDIVMELTSTGATITLEARSSGDCGVVCFEYDRALTFGCKKANQFNLIKFSGTDGLGLPACVCVSPSTATGSFDTACACYSAAADVPGTVLLTVSGVTAGVAECGTCSAPPNDELCVPCNALNGTFTLPAHQSVACTWVLTNGEAYGGSGLNRWSVAIGIVDVGGTPKLRIQAYLLARVWCDEFGTQSFISNETYSEDFDVPASCNITGDYTLSNTNTESPVRCNYPDTVTVTFNSTLPVPSDSGHCSGCSGGGSA